MIRVAEFVSANQRNPREDAATLDEILDHGAKAAFEPSLTRDRPPARRGEPR